MCIHSVVVDETKRRTGIATWMLASYLHNVKSLGSVSRVLLICKEPLIPLYAAVGFKNLGLSDVVHGKDPWILMSVD